MKVSILQEERGDDDMFTSSIPFFLLGLFFSFVLSFLFFYSSSSLLWSDSLVCYAACICTCKKGENVVAAVAAWHYISKSRDSSTKRITIGMTGTWLVLVRRGSRLVSRDIDMYLYLIW